MYKRQATPWPGYALDSAKSAAYITYEIGEDGSLKLGFPDGATIAYPYAKIQDINGLLELTEDDVLNIDVSWHQEMCIRDRELIILLMM